MSPSLVWRTWTRIPGLGLLLLAVLVTINAVAIAGIVAERRQARVVARNELVLETEAHARALEAVLATLRGDFIFLARSLPLFRFLSAIDSQDPMVRRWGRLDVQGTLLLALESNPALARVTVSGAEGRPLIVAGRRQGVPDILPRDAPLPPPAGLLHGRWPMGAPTGDAGALEVWIEVEALLAIAAPGYADRLRWIGDDRVDDGPGTAADQLEARVPVDDDTWSPPLAGYLVRREDQSALYRSVETLAGRYRTTVVLNVSVMTLALGLGLLAYRQLRRAARLQTANAQQAWVRELERQLLHQERLATVGRLAAGMAHEINNPLAGMGNYLRLLEEDLAAGRDDELEALAAKVREGLERTAGVTRQVLALADPGKAPKSALDLRDVLAETVAFLDANTASQQVEIRLAPAPEPLIVHGNAITLGQLFLNLALNACQAQPAGGRVEVAAHRRGESVVVTVDDHGPGVDAETRGRLFEPFVSTRGSTGLGLAVCRGIAIDHEGAIEAADRPGGGARFVVRLPAAGRDQAAPEAEVPRAAAAAGGGR